MSIRVKTTIIDPFENLYIETILAKDENEIFIGYENGLIQKIIFLDNKIIKQKTYHNLLQQMESKKNDGNFESLLL